MPIDIEDVIQANDPKKIPYGQQIDLMERYIESRCQELRRMARSLNFENYEMNDLVENIVLTIDQNIRQTAELATLFSIIATEKERETSIEVAELKRDRIEKLEKEVAELKRKMVLVFEELKEFS